MTRRPVKTGDSKLMQYKIRFEKERGPLTQDGKNWTDGEIDILLDMWLEGRGIKVIAHTLERPIETVKNKIWKLATGYQNNRLYLPGERSSRGTGLLTRREREICEWGLYGDGQKISGDRTVRVDKVYIARILNRPIKIIQRYIDSRTPTSEGFLDSL